MVLANFASQLSGGSPVIVGVFRGVQVPAFPAQLEPMFVATEIEADPHEAGEHAFTLKLIDEDGRVLYENGFEAEFVKRPDFVPSYMYFCGQVYIEKPFEKPGLYRFDLSWRGETLAETRLEVYPSDE